MLLFSVQTLLWQQKCFSNLSNIEKYVENNLVLSSALLINVNTKYQFVLLIFVWSWKIKNNLKK